MKPIVIALIALLLLGFQQAFAEDSQRPEVLLAAYKVSSVQDASGIRESLTPLADVRPGDVVEYTATYVNRSSGTVRNVLLTVPVPAGGLEYVSAQKAPLADSASADGKFFAPLPLTRVETNREGKAVVKPVPLADYRLLRWNLGDLPAGATRSVRARMRMPALAAAAASEPSSRRN